MVNEFGDYQTPISLVKKVVDILRVDGVDPEHILEPTFGEGNFITGALSVFNGVRMISGFEIQKDYYNQTISKLNVKKNIELNLVNGSIFDYDLNDFFDEKKTLVIGNPPWVTSSQLSVLGSKNIPRKFNLKGLSGFDSITGKSNFDIAEYISIMLLSALSRKKGSSVLALLVKNVVPKNILKNIRNSNLNISRMRLYNFDSQQEFGVSADASLMLINVNDSQNRTLESEVYNLDNPGQLLFKFGWVSDRFVSNIKNYGSVKNIDGHSRFIWRSGMKHDASNVMELLKTDSLPVNGLSEPVDIEPELVYDLLKSSDIRKSVNHVSTRKQVIVTQKNIGVETNWIEYRYPKTWNYLTKHSVKLDNRKSSIYKKNPRFSIFGVGEYSFAPYKVAISGMYKDPVFSLVQNNKNKPIMVDDTVYFLPFYDKRQALIALATLNNIRVKTLLSAIAFSDSKRPYTKDILMRINIQKAAKDIGLDEINDYLINNQLDSIIADDLVHFTTLSTNFDNNFPENGTEHFQISLL